MSEPHPIENLLEHARWLDGLARRLVSDEHRADEVVQETWLVAVRRVRSFDPGQASFLAWLRGIAANVEFIPWVPYEEKERLSCQASMGIITFLPYSNNTSCLPNKLFDYMLVSLPVIASNFPLYKEVVEPHQCGLIVDPEKPEAIAEAMTYLIEHPAEARCMGENGRRAVTEQYNWDRESKKLLRIYETILGANGG